LCFPTWDWCLPLLAAWQRPSVWGPSWACWFSWHCLPQGWITFWVIVARSLARGLSVFLTSHPTLTLSCWCSWLFLSYVAVDRPGLRSPMIGTPYSESRTLENTSRLPYYVVIQPDSERVTVDPEVALVEAGERLEYSLSTTAPGETGHYVEPVSIRVYPAFMAEATFRSLYQYHFALPLIVAFSPLLLGLLAVGVWWLWRWRGSQGLVMNWMIRRRGLFRRVWKHV